MCVSRASIDMRHMPMSLGIHTSLSIEAHVNARVAR